MAYRGEDAGESLAAPTADGDLSVNLGPNRLSLAVGALSLHLVDRTATVTERVGKKQKTKRTSFAITGLVYGRGHPRDDIGLWVEVKEELTKPTGTKKPPPKLPREALVRIFGISPASLMEPNGLRSLAKLEQVASRLRVHVEEYAASAGIWFARGTEIGTGHPLDRVLFADYGDHHAVYARKLFRDRARLLAKVRHEDGKVIIPTGETNIEVPVVSRFGITVRGDYIRFADRHGTDLARISVPWVGPEDREELARRIGQLVHRS